MRHQLCVACGLPAWRWGRWGPHVICQNNGETSLRVVALAPSSSWAPSPRTGQGLRLRQLRTSNYSSRSVMCTTHICSQYDGEEQCLVCDRVCGIKVMVLEYTPRVVRHVDAPKPEWGDKLIWSPACTQTWVSCELDPATGEGNGGKGQGKDGDDLWHPVRDISRSPIV